LQQASGGGHAGCELVPELPEVETTRRGIAPHLVGHRIEQVLIRTPRLRWPVPPALPRLLNGQRIEEVSRRAKYLLLHTLPGAVLVHLGMSGSLRVLPRDTAPRKHDHIDVVLDSGKALRFTDPRRFGCFLWQPHGRVHTLLGELGPEPLAEDFDGDWLFQLSRGRRAPVKNFLMDQRVVVGVGNIYAAEALFAAGIDPRRAAGRVSLARYRALAESVREILQYAIRRGGTTLRDFTDAEGEPGYFETELKVYGREGQRCPVCRTPLRGERIGQRASCYCPKCQT
jgi:formamidopyrimidine-DNA glycosylase